jgi:CMP-N,N'-diacetyllegionaminic acid synthase
MLEGRRVLAVVPARSGSKGIPDKNIQLLGGLSLIGWAGEVLKKIPWIDTKIISTDSKVYANDAKKHGLESIFLRPSNISGDAATAIDTIVHSLESAESYYNAIFDIILIVEPTSPYRFVEDLMGATQLLIESGSDSVVCVSPIDTKYHPYKVLKVLNNKKLIYFDKKGAGIQSRQQLDTLYARNGVCYALTRDCIMLKKSIITEKTVAYIIDHYTVNIDEPIDLEWAEFLHSKGLFDYDNRN